MQAHHNALSDNLLNNYITNKFIRAFLLAFVGSLLLWASAKITVPFYPVPATMQTFAIFVIGLAYSPRLALATLALYLAQGAIGLPVFAGAPEKGIGIAYMMGPTGGYLIGFVLAVLFLSVMVQKFAVNKSFVKIIATLLGASFFIYVPGLLYLAQFIGIDKAMEFGLLPFIYSDMAKICLAAATMLSLRKWC